MDNELFLYNRVTKLAKFKIVGYLPSPEFQKCRYLANKLHVCYPKEYDLPEIRSMLNVDWEHYLTKMKRRHGTPYYLLKSSVVVYLDGQFLGDDRALESFIKDKYKLHIDIDFDSVVEQEIIRYFTELIETKKLYNDLVPITCDNFLSRCSTVSAGYGYKCTPIHRIAKYSWIQCGGTKLTGSEMPCENYSVPHDRRGVLSMCNTKRHTNNTTQFYVTLNPASWMDYNYVAFGQLIQGAEILNLIEKVPTCAEVPNRMLEITNCGEFTLCTVPEEDYARALNPPYGSLFFTEFKDDDDVDSVLTEDRFRMGKYFLRTDNKSYLPFQRYSRMFDVYMGDIPEPDIEILERMSGRIEDVEEKEVKDEEKEMFKSGSFYEKLF